MGLGSPTSLMYVFVQIKSPDDVYTGNLSWAASVTNN